MISESTPTHHDRRRTQTLTTPPALPPPCCSVTFWTEWSVGFELDATADAEQPGCCSGSRRVKKCNGAFIVANVWLFLLQVGVRACSRMPQPSLLTHGVTHPPFCQQCGGLSLKLLNQFRSGLVKEDLMIRL